MADPLVTPQQLSDYTGGKISPTDPRVQPLLDGATAAVRRYCGWHIAPVLTETMTLDGPGGYLLQLPTLHVESITSITEKTELVDPDDYEWSATGEVRKLDHCDRRWTHRYRAVVVELSHGFASAADVVEVILQVCANALASPMGATREQAGQVAVSWATTAPGVSGGMSLLQRDLDVLSLYKLPPRI